MGNILTRRIAYSWAGNTLALVLLLAAGLKAIQLSSPTIPPQSFLRLPVALSSLGIVGEWFVGTWLMTAIARSGSWRATMTLLIVFASVSGWRLWTGSSECGCFGEVHFHPAWTFTFDCAALVLLGWLGFPIFSRPCARSSAAKPTSDRIIFAVTLGIAVPAALLAVSRELGQTAKPVVIIDAGSLQGKRFPLLEYVDDVERSDLLTGSRTVIVYSHDCDICRSYLSQMKSALKSVAETAVIRVIDIAPPVGGTERYTTLSTGPSPSGFDLFG